ncbi:MarR family transcriptional regulator [uncultured Methylibium sp.]|uniref:MarR family winged helix-turn-helix transcriptional regulator n=1 Tax=uncultured Methylibium sp. TaxID=381093 RepID=UPI0025F95B4E|nr:MarR family transcriptional regulator [uncultured Methylibium sp.]
MATSRKPEASRHPAPSAILLDEQLCFALYAASLAMTKIYRPLLAQIDLTYPQYVALLALWECDGLTIGELGQRVALDSGTLTPLLKRMQAQGLVERTRSAADERQVLITLTRRGAELQTRVGAVHDQVACATACSARERQSLTAALHALRGALLAGAAG